MTKVITNDQSSEGTRKDGVQVIVDLTACIGAGPCVIAAEKVFQIRSSDGKAIIVDPDANTIEQIREAAESCPVLAIKLKKDNQQIFP